jgi:hypothetical protein
VSKLLDLVWKTPLTNLTAGQDVTDAFYSLHRHEVLQKSQFARLQIGTIKGEESVIASRDRGQFSAVPYAEPTWQTQGYYSPYYKEVRVCLSHNLGGDTDFQCRAIEG